MVAGAGAPPGGAAGMAAAAAGSEGCPAAAAAAGPPCMMACNGTMLGYCWKREETTNEISALVWKIAPTTATRRLHQTHFGSNLHQLAPQLLVSIVQILVFPRQSDDGPLELLDHGLLALAALPSGHPVLLQPFPTLAVLDLLIVGGGLGHVFFSLAFGCHGFCSN